MSLPRTGVYAYADHPTTDVWCCAYAVNDEPPKLWWPGDPVPAEFREAATSPEWEVAAFNDAFEANMEARLLARKYTWPVVPRERHRCVMVEAMALSLPAKLEHVAPALGISDGKDMEGHRLMLRMMSPRRPRKGEDPRGLYWWDDPERKARLGQYCVRDVEVEREVERRILRLRPAEQRLWFLDQQINDRGIAVDADLCNAATKVVTTATGWLNEEMRDLTDASVSSTTNVAQIAAWLAARGVHTDSLDKEHIDALLGRSSLPVGVRRVLELRREAAKTANKKIDALLAGLNDDGRTRGLLQFHAASTGRWAGRRFQPQNIKRPELDDVDAAIETVATGSAELVGMLYGNPLAVVGDCLRGMVRAGPDRELIAADFSNIEGRVLAWLAGEEWKLDAFRSFDAGTGPDIYIKTYCETFGVPLFDKKDPRRQVGKVEELASGFQGGIGAWLRMGAVGPMQAMLVKLVKESASEAEWAAAAEKYDGSHDLDEEAWTAIRIAVDRWRAAHPRIKAFWYALEEASAEAVSEPGAVVRCGKLAFRKSGSFLFLRLPSGRSLSYPYPRVEMAPVPWRKKEPEWVTFRSEEEAMAVYGEHFVEWDPGTLRALVYMQASKPRVVYKGVDSFTRHWGDCHAYGGLWAENVTQAVARDILAEAMVRLEAAGYPIVLHVHDEIVSEVGIGVGSVEEFEEIMVQVPDWAQGLPIAAEAWHGPRYRKG